MKLLNILKYIRNKGRQKKINPIKKENKIIKEGDLYKKANIFANFFRKVDLEYICFNVSTVISKSKSLVCIVSLGDESSSSER